MIPGCNCYEEERRQGKNKRTVQVCKAIIIQGKKENFSFTESNFTLMMVLGMILAQGSWILPLIIWMTLTNHYLNFGVWLAVQRMQPKLAAQK